MNSVDLGRDDDSCSGAMEAWSVRNDSVGCIGWDDVVDGVGLLDSSHRDAVIKKMRHELIVCLLFAS